MQDSKFHLKVLSREGLLFEGDVISASSFNDKGKFDILSEHANFISLITRYAEIVDNNKQFRKIEFDNALIRVKKNNAEIYIGIQGLVNS